MDRAVRLLPQPDSPTRQSVSPGRTRNETSSTRQRGPVGPDAFTVRSRISRSGVSVVGFGPSSVRSAIGPPSTG